MEIFERKEITNICSKFTDEVIDLKKDMKSYSDGELLEEYEKLRTFMTHLITWLIDNNMIPVDYKLLPGYDSMEEIVLENVPTDDFTGFLIDTKFVISINSSANKLYRRFYFIDWEISRRNAVSIHEKILDFEEHVLIGVEKIQDSYIFNIAFSKYDIRSFERGRKYYLKKRNEIITQLHIELMKENPTLNFIARLLWETEASFLFEV